MGKKWKFTLKYILPLMLIIMWIIGVAQLIYEVDLFKLGIYLLISVIVLGFSIFFVKVRPNGQDSKE